MGLFVSLASLCQSRVKFRESGHTLLYTTVFMPLVLGGLALAFDLSGINLRAERFQSALDTITLDAAQYLPELELAKKRALDRINQLGSQISDPKVEVDLFHSRIAASFTLSEDQFILPKLLAAAGYKSKIQSHTKRIVSESELVPVDIAIVLSDGVDERPWQGLIENSPWPQSNGIGQASSALSGCIAPPLPRYSNVSASQVWSRSKDWLTQSCFNPVFFQFKLAAMNLAGSFLSVGTNRVAVIFTPSSNGIGETIRHAVPKNSQDLDISGYLKVGQAPKASFVPAQDLEFELGDEACIILSDVMTAYAREYSIDRFTRNESDQRRCLNPIQNSMCGAPFSIGQEGRLDLDCVANTSLAEAVYWRSAKRPENKISANPDFYSALGLALSEILPDETQIKSDRVIRGKLAESPGRAIILLTSILPKLDISHPVIQGMLNSKVALVIGFMERSEYPSSLVDSAEQDTRVIEWRDFIERQMVNTRIKSSIYIANKPEEMNRLVVAKIIGTIRKVLLRL